MRRSVLAVIGSIAVPVAHATFTDSCWFYVLGIKGIQIGNYYAICGDDQQHTHIDLNRCLFNNNGGLFFQSDGGAFGACTCVSRTDLTQVIDCQCQNNVGDTVPASINLDDGLRYDSDRGVLACMDNYGSQDSATALNVAVLSDGTIQWK